MILINLLPEEYHKKKVSLSIPLKEISLSFSILFLILWGLVLIQSGYLKKDLAHFETELKSLSPDLAQAEQITREMTQDIIPKKTFLDSLERPEVQWDRVMNLISDALPDGVWLSLLTLSEVPEFSIRIEGLAQTHRERSGISLVGDFVTRLKKELGELVAPPTKIPQANTASPTVQASERNLINPSTLRAETFTQQKETASTKLTQFIVELRKK